VGLSYKFNSNRVLEKRDVEFQGKDKDGKVRDFIFFQEFHAIKEGQVMISIEHW
jgi:hypothetical protein